MDNKRYTCNVCNESFNSKQLAHKHRAKHHFTEDFIIKDLKGFNKFTLI